MMKPGESASRQRVAGRVEIRHVLSPVDFSDSSRRALDHAIAVAKWYGSRLTVLYVRPVAAPAVAPFAGLTTAAAESLVIAAGDREDVRRQLEAFTPAAAVKGIPVDFCVGEGDVAAEILARVQQAGMVVMATHGRSGLEHLVLGSVAEKVLREAPCPLLTVPRAAPDATDAVPGLFHHIIAAVDFSDVSMRALEYAVSLAEETDARLTVLHVIDIPPAPALWVDRRDRANVALELRDKGEELLRNAVPDDVRVYCHIEERVETGEPHREILRVADERRAGLLVIGAHGRGMVERMFVGSTAQQIVRQATCPVLTIRQP